MTDQPESVDATFWVTIEPKWHRYWTDQKKRPVLEGAKVVSMTQNRPTGRTKAGAIVTRMTLRVDSAALLPLQPEAVIHITAGQVDLIEVTADAPPEDEG